MARCCWLAVAIQMERLVRRCRNRPGKSSMQSRTADRRPQTADLAQKRLRMLLRGDPSPSHWPSTEIPVTSQDIGSQRKSTRVHSAHNSDAANFCVHSAPRAVCSRQCSNVQTTRRSRSLRAAHLHQRSQKRFALLDSKLKTLVAPTLRTTQRAHFKDVQATPFARM